jgi:hypothetical protein
LAVACTMTTPGRTIGTKDLYELGGTPQCQHCPTPHPQSYIRICEHLSVRAMSVQPLLYIAPAGIRGVLSRDASGPTSPACTD